MGQRLSCRAFVRLPATLLCVGFGSAVSCALACVQNEASPVIVANAMVMILFFFICFRFKVFVYDANLSQLILKT